MSDPIFPALFGNRVTAFFTTKAHGAEPDALARISRHAARAVYLPIQRHTDKVLFVDNTFEPAIADAVLTDRKGVLVGVKTADCVPVLVYEPVRGVVGAVHAGWRGTASAILSVAVRAAVERYACEAAKVLVAIGPSIGRCCYEVDPDVAHQVKQATGEGDYAEKKGSKFHLDLREANRIQAVRAGVRQEHIWISGECTRCSPERFFSYRYSGASSGRQGGFIGMNEE